MPSAPLGIVASHDHFKEATGGTKTYSGGYTIHTFNSSGTFTIGAKGTRVIEWEIIGAGGAGGESGPSTKLQGQRVGGGGGAGGYITDSLEHSPFYRQVDGSTITNIAVEVGGGGGSAQGNPSRFDLDGNNDVAIAPLFRNKKTGVSGGGLGGGYFVTFGGPNNTWSGSDYSGSGGGGEAQSAAAGSGANGHSPNGNAGGSGATSFKGGGGGGAGGAGGNGGTNGGNGGTGTNSVCGGGGGGVSSGTAGTASDGGGAGSSGGTGSAGTANTGGGGGGSGNTGTQTAGGNGGSGKIIIKYLTV